MVNAQHNCVTQELPAKRRRMSVSFNTNLFFCFILLKGFYCVISMGFSAMTLRDLKYEEDSQALKSLFNNTLNSLLRH